MSYPCFGCGCEVGSECLCSHCAADIKRTILNGEWCSRHQIIHWSGQPCPICRMDETCDIDEMVEIMEGV